MAQAGRISNQQLKMFLQEDAFWQTRFLEWETIGVKKLRKVGDSYTNEFLSIEDIRNEILSSIQ